MISQDLLNILACPETKGELEVATPEVIEKINQLVQQGTLTNRGNQLVSEKIDGGLIRKADRKYLYPIRQDIPIMLIDEAIPLEKIQ